MPHCIEVTLIVSVTTAAVDVDGANATIIKANREANNVFIDVFGIQGYRLKPVLH